MDIKRKWWKHLIAIPIMLVIDVIGFVIAALVDVYLLSTTGGEGHDFPLFTLLICAALIVVTIIVMARMIILIIGDIIYNIRG